MILLLLLLLLFNVYYYYLMFIIIILCPFLSMGINDAAPAGLYRSQHHISTGFNILEPFYVCHVNLYIVIANQKPLSEEILPHIPLSQFGVFFEQFKCCDHHVACLYF